MDNLRAIRLVTWTVAAILLLAMVLGASLRAEPAPRNLPDNQAVRILVQHCETNRDQQQWIEVRDPEVAIAFIRLVYGYIDPWEFKQIVTAMGFDPNVTNSILEDCFDLPGQGA